MSSLLGVIIRFREEDIALTCDVEQMFHLFHVTLDHRDFLRFLWLKNNNPLEEIVEYRMLVHLFDNASSPAIATFGRLMDYRWTWNCSESNQFMRYL